VDECKPLTHVTLPLTRFQGFFAAAASFFSVLAASSQGLTLVHFSAQLEPFLTQNAP